MPATGVTRNLAACRRPARRIHCLRLGGSTSAPMKRTFAVTSSIVSAIIAGFWLTVLVGNHSHSVEIPPSADHRDYLEGRKKTRFHVLLTSDRRGIVFDLFVRRLPPEKAPGPPWSEETQRWLKPRAQRTASAYARLVGFEKGIEYRHGQYLNEPIYFYGTDYYFAVPHVLLIIVAALPGLCLVRRWFRDRALALTEPGAPASGGPAAGLGNSGITGGPPSVS